MIQDNLFKKINVNMPTDFDSFKLKGEKQISYGGSLSYYHIKDREYFSNIFPSLCKIPPATIFYVEIIGNIKPHRDHNVSCCINYYFTSNNSTTYFYKHIENTAPWVFPGKKTANIYASASVECVDKFKSDDNETYLLNVSEIHSVNTKSSGVRRFITWQWTPSQASYQDILDNLNYSVF